MGFPAKWGYRSGKVLLQINGLQAHGGKVLQSINELHKCDDGTKKPAV